MGILWQCTVPCKVSLKLSKLSSCRVLLAQQVGRVSTSDKSDKSVVFLFHVLKPALLVLAGNAGRSGHGGA